VAAPSSPVARPVVVLVGHGAAAKDCPRELVSRLKALEGARRARREPPSDEERALDARVRGWPRTEETDPYGAGLDVLRAALAARLPGVRVLVAFNELAAPSLEEAIRGVLSEGVRDVYVVTSMPTPGGVHAEVEIPEALDALRAEHPDARITYAWPFDARAVAELFAAALERAGLTPSAAR
jgi:sirohydrochlorin cobaltochelatase